jgi:hypothetical protein
LESLSGLLAGFVLLGIALIVDVKKESGAVDSDGAQRLPDANMAPQAKTNWSSLAGDAHTEST